MCRKRYAYIISKDKVLIVPRIIDKLGNIYYLAISK